MAEPTRDDLAARAAAIFGDDVASITEEPRPPDQEPATVEGRRWHLEEHGNPCRVIGCFFAARIRVVEREARQQAVDEIDAGVREALRKVQGDATREWLKPRPPDPPAPSTTALELEVPA